MEKPPPLALNAITWNVIFLVHIHSNHISCRDVSHDANGRCERLNQPVITPGTTIEFPILPFLNQSIRPLFIVQMMSLTAPLRLPLSRSLDQSLLACLFQFEQWFNLARFSLRVVFPGLVSRVVNEPLIQQGSSLEQTHLYSVFTAAVRGPLARDAAAAAHMCLRCLPLSGKKTQKWFPLNIVWKLYQKKNVFDISFFVSCRRDLREFIEQNSFLKFFKVAITEFVKKYHIHILIISLNIVCKRLQ